MKDKDRLINGLIIEDDAEDTMLLMELMSRAEWPAFRFAFECAETLEAGLKCLAAGEFEVVLLDLMLPDSQGLDTILKVRAHAPDVPVVVLTGMRDEALGLAALEHGAQDYQVKGSLDGHALKRTIGYAVERHRMLMSLKAITQNSPDGIVITDAKGLVHYVNPAAETLLGASSASLVGRPFPHSLPNSRSGEIKLPPGGGGERFAEVRISEIQWKDQPARLASIRDITELRRIEQLKAEVLESRRMDKLKDELISAVSHEMRSPLSIIKAATSTLRDGLAGPLNEKQSHMVIMQDKNVLRLQKILDHILDLSRLESGRAQIRPLRVSALELIRDALSGFRLVAGERGILIQQDLPAELPHIHADPELFNQVLGNLIDNAMRFTKTRVIISARTEEAPANARGAGGASVLTARRLVRFSVSDDGQGIPPERIGDLFDKFVQVNRSTVGEGYRGTGLGLAICKEIVERQGGSIEAESDGVGRGSRFHFTLPRFEAGK